MHILIKELILLKVLFVVFNEQRLESFDDVINTIEAREQELYQLFLNSDKTLKETEPKTLYAIDKNGIAYHKDNLYITVIAENEKDIKLFGDTERTLVLRMTEAKETLQNN